MAFILEVSTSFSEQRSQWKYNDTNKDICGDFEDRSLHGLFLNMFNSSPTENGNDSVELFFCLKIIML